MTAAFAAVALLLVGLVGLTAHFAVGTIESERARFALEERDSALVDLLLALGESQNAVRGYVIVGDLGYLEAHYHALEPIAGLVERLDATFAEKDRGRVEALGRLIAERLDHMAAVLQATESGGLAAGQAMIRAGLGERQMADIRRDVGETIAEARDEMRIHGDAVYRNTAWLAGSVGMAALVALALSLVQFGLFRAEIAMRGRTESELEIRNGGIRLLSELSGALQAANLREEGYALIEVLVGRLLGGMPGALYIYSPARDQLHLAASWGSGLDLASLPASFAPDACWALRRGMPLAGRVGASAINCTHVERSDHSYLCMPIQAQGAVIGLLHLVSPALDHESAFQGVMDVARGLSEQLSLALANIELRERLRNMAIRDGLTGLYNRRFLEEVLERELARAERNGTKVAVAMLDIDHFKAVNDGYGHGIGDEVLKRIAAYLTGAVRKTDIVCRYGGEEIVIVLPDCDVERAGVVCEKLREGVAGLDLSTAGANLPRVTVSIGVTAYPDLCGNKAELVHSADMAMYRAKRGGRNRVCLADAGEPQDSRPAPETAEAGIVRTAAVRS